MAWTSLGWRCAFVSEIERFPCAVLKHYLLEVPNYGDMLKFNEWTAVAIDVLVGGTPCQSFSVAGLRGGLADPRGNLTLGYLAVLAKYQPRWCVWENVPGILSDDERAFDQFLDGLTQCGYGWAWRVLDAQYFGLAQRRERVFVVGHSGGQWQRAAAVLFDGESLRGNPAPRRQAGQRVAPTVEGRAGRSGANNFATSGGLAETARSICGQSQSSHREDSETFIPVAGTLSSAFGKQRGAGQQPEGLVPEVAWAIQERDSKGADSNTKDGHLICHSLTSEGFDASEDGTGRGTPLIAFSCKDDGRDAQQDIAPTARSMNHSESHANAGGQLAVAFNVQSQNSCAMRGKGPSKAANKTDVARAQDSAGFAANQGGTLIAGPTMAVRRLTPREVERLQGFPDERKAVTIVVCRSEAERHEIASSATANSQAQSRAESEHAAAHVLIDLERQHLQLHSHGKLCWSANVAASENSFPLRIAPADFVRIAVLMTATVGPAIRIGKAALPASTKPSSHPFGGNRFVLLCGSEITELAANAERFTNVLHRCLKFTMSEVGLSSMNSERNFQTLCCCVVAAMSTFIPAETFRAGSFALKLETLSGYTLIRYRGKPACDGNRYRALGNSMAVPVMQWLGRRIEIVESLAPSRQGGEP